MKDQNFKQINTWQTNISKSEDFTYLVTEADRISEILENNSYQGYCCDVYKYYGNAYALVYVTSTKM